MKVMLLNGSPNEKGCTYTALREVEKVLNNHEIKTEMIYLGKKPIAGCIACSKCFETGRCIWNDKVNEIAERLDEIDGLIIGSPVYYASANGSLTAFLDRLFFSAGDKMAGKLGASIVSCRRAGSTATFDQLNKYFTISNMPIVSSNYWNKGLQIMRTLGENMAWLLKCIEAGKKMNIQKPEYEEKIMTNFIK